MALHPGFIKTEITRDLKNTPGPMSRFFELMIRLFAKKTKDGAKASIYCATSDDITKKNGLYIEY